MKQKFLKTFLLSFILVMMFAIPSYAAEFSCYTYDEQNHKINGYYSEHDDTWYLFLTSSQSVTGSMLCYDGNISDSSGGELDTQAKTISEAFAKNGDSVELTSEDGERYHIVAMRSSLPSVYIDLEGTTLEDIHTDKEIKHKNNSIYITSPDEEYNLTVENSVEIKGRGNTTWRDYEKKAYQIKFDDKTSVLGMGKAKKWVLLANASDDSMMRTKLVYDMAENLDMDYVCDMEYVDLWIEGEYRGTFLLGEKAEPGSSRLNLQEDNGALFEHDEAFYLEEDYWFYSKSLGRHFVLKEIVEEEDTLIAAAMKDFESSIEDLMRYLYYTNPEDVTLDMLSMMIDVDSFAKYYLINEYVLNKESFATSFYWYKDGEDDVIHLGPLWDFDTCMGNDKSSYLESYGHTHTLFHYLLAAPEFNQRAQELYEDYSIYLKGMEADADILKQKIDVSAEMNYIRWDVLGQANPKGGSDFYPTFDEAVEAVQIWLSGREEAFEIAQPEVEFSTEHVAMFRLYNPNSGEHFYTGSAVERDTLILAGWNFEGIAWSTPVHTVLPIYRVYNPNAGDHHYTGSMEEVNNLVTVGWHYEGVAWNTPLSGIPVYRLYNPNAISGAHHYTPSVEERDYLVSLGWQYENVAWNGAE